MRKKEDGGRMPESGATLFPETILRFLRIFAAIFLQTNRIDPGV
jgi:hypothetical protein